MNIELLIISTIVFLALLSIVIGIINWVYLSSTSAKISFLEAEIEKKAKEFDAIKKEKPQQAAENPGQSASFSGPAGPSIEIVRNVRAEFQQPGSQFVNQGAGPGEREQSFVKEQSFAPPAEEAALMNAPYAPPAKGPSADVLDVVEESVRDPSSSPIGNDRIEIALFSHAKNDTDFPSAWKKLTDHLVVTHCPHVVIDFSNVMFLYEKELRYLEKIQDIVSKANGITAFINCHPELLPTISSRRLLVQCLQD